MCLHLPSLDTYYIHAPRATYTSHIAKQHHQRFPTSCTSTDTSNTLPTSIHVYMSIFVWYTYCMFVYIYQRQIHTPIQSAYVCLHLPTSDTHTNPVYMFVYIHQHQIHTPTQSVYVCLHLPTSNTHTNPVSICLFTSTNTRYTHQPSQCMFVYIYQHQIHTPTQSVYVWLYINIRYTHQPSQCMFIYIHQHQIHTPTQSVYVHIYQHQIHTPTQSVYVCLHLPTSDTHTNPVCICSHLPTSDTHTNPVCVCLFTSTNTRYTHTQSVCLPKPTPDTHTNPVSVCLLKSTNIRYTHQPRQCMFAKIYQHQMCKNQHVFHWLPPFPNIPTEAHSLTCTNHKQSECPPTQYTNVSLYTFSYIEHFRVWRCIHTNLPAYSVWCMVLINIALTSPSLTYMCTWKPWILLCLLHK